MKKLLLTAAVLVSCVQTTKADDMLIYLEQLGGLSAVLTHCTKSSSQLVEFKNEDHEHLMQDITLNCTTPLKNFLDYCEAIGTTPQLCSRLAISIIADSIK